MAYATLGKVILGDHIHHPSRPEVTMLLTWVDCKTCMYFLWLRTCTVSVINQLSLLFTNVHISIILNMLQLLLGKRDTAAVRFSKTYAMSIVHILEVTFLHKNKQNASFPHHITVSVNVCTHEKSQWPKWASDDTLICNPIKELSMQRYAITLANHLLNGSIFAESWLMAPDWKYRNMNYRLK